MIEYRDIDNISFSLLWRAGSELNAIIKRARNYKPVTFFSEDGSKSYHFDDSPNQTPAKFIECIWEYDYCTFENVKYPLYFSHKLLALSAYEVDPNTNEVKDLRPINTFASNGVEKAFKDLCKRNITYKELIERCWDEQLKYEDEGK